MSSWHDFPGPNAGYILELYDRYLQDPQAVDEATRRYFEHWTPPVDGAALAPQIAAAGVVNVEKVVGAANLAQAIRAFGHLAAQLDPLGSNSPGDPELDPGAHGLTEADLRLLPATLISGPLSEESADAREAIDLLRQVYCGRIGYDFEHVRAPAEREWLRHAIEAGLYRQPAYPIDAVAILRRLTQVEAFEHFLHRIFPGKTRFSIEGLDMMVPILDELVRDAAESGTCAILIGMAHRGRLNVLAHILEKPYTHILAEFKDPGGNFATRDELGWTGDVKYHKGKEHGVYEDKHVELVIELLPNPSHLEHVNPVVLGMSRAADTAADKAGPPRLFHNASLPIVIHGDASFPGQGVVAETLNMMRLPGYTVGGTVHIIANNQLGFTTTTGNGRSTLYASDLAKGFKIPIIHVNADDVEGCIEVARLACAYRSRFQKDVLIDLIGYRRYGHNEGDEPSFTQPQMYAVIDHHPSVRAQWAQHLISSAVIEQSEAEALVERQMAALQEALEAVEEISEDEDFLEPQLEPPPPGAAKRVATGVPADELRQLNQELKRFPDGFKPNPKLERAMKRRRTALDEMNQSNIDWATAEELALASILADGIPIRITGEDSERGTFSQRHAVFHDVDTGATYIPLQHISQSKAAFEVHNSPLSENAALGFEYGYNIAYPGRLVIWEAQYGDFVNGAQPMIDEFIVSGRAKWEQTPSLILLLPHGHEGQGPDHSSGRPERFLQLAAETNLRLANPTTAAQYFHLLRRQAALLKTDPLPLIVMTPKSLLRHPLASSPLRDLAEGHWQPVIDDPLVKAQAKEVRRLILCSGKVYVDLVSSSLRPETPAVAIARLEQLYRFPQEEMQKVLANYPNLEEIVWLQEEPQNMGAWDFIRPCLNDLIKDRWPLRYLGRPRRASPAEGSATWHSVNQKAIIRRAFELGH